MNECLSKPHYNGLPRTRKAEPELSHQLRAGSMASAQQFCIFTTCPHHWCPFCYWPQFLSVKTRGTWDWFRLRKRGVCGLPSTSDKPFGTSHYTVASHSAGSRWGTSRPSCGAASTSPREAGWAGVWASQVWGCGFSLWWTGSRSQRSPRTQRPRRGSSRHPHGRSPSSGCTKVKKALSYNLVLLCKTIKWEFALDVEPNTLNMRQLSLLEDICKFKLSINPSSLCCFCFFDPYKCECLPT